MCACRTTCIANSLPLYVFVAAQTKIWPHSMKVLGQQIGASCLLQHVSQAEQSGLKNSLISLQSCRTGFHRSRLLERSSVQERKKSQ